MIRGLINLLLVIGACIGAYWLWSSYTGRSWQLPEGFDTGGGSILGGFGKALCGAWGGC